MNDLDQILALWEETGRAAESAVLATVVKTFGSSYRMPGARMLLTRDGKRAGAVSGGCLEDDLVKKSWWLTEAGPVVRRYDTTPDGELATGGYGLGCNGIIHLLLERVSARQADPVLPVIQRVRAGRRPAIVTQTIGPAAAVGRRAVLEDCGELVLQASHTEELQDGSEVFVETLTPPLRLLVFGAGDDAVPMTNLAKFLGWQVIVADGRAHYARRAKFPAADRLLVRHAGEPLPPEMVDPWTAAVVMSHSYIQDLDVIRELARKPPRYVGILGPRKRAVQLFSDAGLDVAGLDSELHTPIGLDIGADGAEQVALAVAAEIQAAFNGRSGGCLRDRAGSIHAREAVEDGKTLWARSIVCA